MSHTVVEIASIRLKSGVTEQELIAASDAFQRFLGGVNGFVRRELLRRGDGDYADLVHWRDKNAADAMMAAAGTSSECGSYFALMDLDRHQGVVCPLKINMGGDLRRNRRWNVRPHVESHRFGTAVCIHKHKEIRLARLWRH